MLHKQRNAPSRLIQLNDLFLMELTNWRWSWRSMVVLGMAMPILSMLALGTFASGSSVETKSYILIGNIVLALMFENLDKVSSRFAFMRFMGSLDYFATLPIQRYLLILSTVLSFFVLSLPALIVTMIFGSWFLGIPLTPHPLVLLVVPLCAVSLAGIGALIGTIARTPEEGSSLNLLVTMILLGLGPVIIPADRLPGFLVFLGNFSPTTYAASALRQVLLGPVTGKIALDLAVLAGLALLIFWAVSQRMDWRER